MKGEGCACSERLNHSPNVGERRKVEDRGEPSFRTLRPLRLIINADDFGLSHEINERIVGLLKRGCLTSATLLANGTAVEEAARSTADHPHGSFGVHLNLTQGRPLTHNPGLRAILDERGCFAGNRIRSIRLTSVLRGAIFLEWSAQIERIRSLGVEVSHLDSHHHVHTLPWLLGVLKRLQKAFKVNKVRLSQNIYGRKTAPLLLLGRKHLWNYALRHYHSTRTTDGFTSFLIFHELLPAGVDGGSGCVELMVHPGAAGFEEETRLLEGNWRAESKRPVELISYHQL